MSDMHRYRVARWLLLVAILSAGGIAACKGDGWAQPAPLAPSGPNLIRIDDPAGRLRLHEATIRKLVNATLAAVTGRLAVSGVTITVTPDAGRAIGGYGIGGFTPDARTVSIYIDPDYPALETWLPDRLPPMVAHELHHAVRHRQPGYGRTLFEAMISEGMADRFSIELLGVPPPPWSLALGLRETDHFLALGRQEFDSPTYDHARWFFGAGELPRWTGYTLGFRLVEVYQAVHDHISAATLVSMPAAAFRIP